MTHRRMPFVAALLALSALSATPSAAEDLEAEAKRQVQMFDDTYSKTKDDIKYAEFVMELTAFPHPVVVDRLARILMKDQNIDRKIIAINALAEFRKPADVRDLAGKALTASLREKEIDFDVKEHAVNAIASLKWKESVPTLNELILDKGRPPDGVWFVLASIRSMATIGDRRALSALLELWERMPAKVKWPGGAEVRVDTGTAGDGDQKAAEAKYKEQNGNGKKKGKPPTDFRVWAQELLKSIYALSGQKFEEPDQLRAWMIANAAELKKEGVEIPEPKEEKKDKKKDQPKDAPKDAK